MARQNDTATPRPGHRPWAKLREFRRNQDGATAIEFGLLAIPFIALLLAILETALVFLAGQTLETAVDNSARLIRTGQAQSGGLTGDTFKAQICSQIVVMPDCTGSLRIDVRTYPTFDSLVLSEPIDSSGKLKSSDFIYDAGHGGDIVMVRAFYEWPTFSKLLGLNFSNLSDGNLLLATTSAFKNEPFPW